MGACRVVALLPGAPSDKQSRAACMHHMTNTFLNWKVRQNSACAQRRKPLRPHPRSSLAHSSHASTSMTTRMIYKALLQFAALADRRKCMKSAENPPSPRLSIFGMSRQFDAHCVKTTLDVPHSRHSTSGFRTPCLSMQTHSPTYQGPLLTYNNRARRTYCAHILAVSQP